MRPIRVLVLLLLAASAQASCFDFPATVVAVADGDTVTVAETGGEGRFKVRLNGIDAPEKGQAFGTAAKKHLAELIAGKAVTVRVRDVDRYGRLIATVILDGADVNLRMVADGYAWVYRHFWQDKAYLDAEAAAKAARAGLWRDAAPVPPWEFRRRTPNQAQERQLDQIAGPDEGRPKRN